MQGDFRPEEQACLLSTTASGIPPTSVAMTGFPTAIASRSVIGLASVFSSSTLKLETQGAGCTDDFRDVEAVPRQADGAVIAGEPFETGTFRTVPDDEPRDPGLAPARLLHCADEDVDALLWTKARDEHSEGKLPAGTPSSARTMAAGLASVSSGTPFWITEIRSGR